MKYRSDFVTNSSSSSFIVIFERADDYNSAVEYLGTVDEKKRSLILKNLEENKRTRKAILSANFLIKSNIVSLVVSEYRYKFSNTFVSKRQPRVPGIA